MDSDEDVPTSVSEEIVSDDKTSLSEMDSVDKVLLLEAKPLLAPDTLSNLLFPVKPLSEFQVSNDLSSPAAADSSSSLRTAAIRVGTFSNSVVDPGSILKWIEVIKSIISSCPNKNSQSLIQAGQEQRLLQRRVLVNRIERHFPNISRNEALLRARHVFEAAANATVQEMTSLVNEVD